MFDYVTSIKSWAHECSPTLFAQIIDSDKVADICAEIEDGREKCLRGEMSREDFQTFKAERKKALPGFNFQAHYINGGRRLDKNAVASGLCIYDKDHVNDPEEWSLSLALPNREGKTIPEEERHRAFSEFCKRMGIVLAHITPSGEGVRLVFRIAKDVSLADAQYSLAKALGDDDYDGSVKDMARISFAVPRDYILASPIPSSGRGEEDAEPFKELFTPTPDDYKMPFKIHRASKSSHKLNGNSKKSTKDHAPGERVCACWKCKRPTKRVMLIIQKAMEKRNITKAAMEQRGQRHYMFVNLLSTGICRLLTKEELMGGLKKVTRIADTDNIWQLVADWYENYLNENKPVSNDFAWTFAEVMNLDDNGTSLPLTPPVGGESEKDGDFDTEDSPLPLEGSGEAALDVSSLPIGLKESLTGLPENLMMPVLCAIMPLAGAYADQVEVRYADGKRQHLGLMSIIVGEQASKKSTCRDIVDIWKRLMHEDDMAQRKMEDDWKQRRKNKKANEKGEPDPLVLIREIPVTTSCSTLLKRLKNSRGHCLYSFGEELDTLRKTNGAGSWSSKYDVYRLSFDRGEWGQDYNSDQAESGMVKVAYNWTILGTYGALKKCFRVDNIENGLSSRMMIAEMPDNRFARLTTFTDVEQADDEQIQKAVDALRSASGYIDTPRLREAMAEWVEQKRVEALQAIDDIKDTYRKRAAVIGFRCGVIFHLLESSHPGSLPPSPSNGRGSTETQQEHPSLPENAPHPDSVLIPDTSPLLLEGAGEATSQEGAGEAESDACLAFAKMMAEYVLKEQSKLFGEGLTDERLASDALEIDKNSNVLAHLPSPFGMDDLRAVKGSSYPESTLRKTISRWRHDGWIEKMTRGLWRKTAS